MGPPSAPIPRAAAAPAEAGAAPHRPEIVDLGRIDYDAALAMQRAVLEEAVRRRDEPGGWPGRILLVEHDPPVVTVTRRPGAAAHVLVSPARLAALGVQLRETDRGGDVTWHGPGQLVAYPIVDLNRIGLRVHGYVRRLESVVVDALAGWDVVGRTDPSATGVWVDDGAASAKICAIGVRVSRWTTMHGLALNVDCDLDAFGLIVPCGLHGRAVTSIARLRGGSAPSIDEAKSRLGSLLAAALSPPRDPVPSAPRG